MTITPEQLKFRAGKIGASSMAQAVGRGYGGRTRAELFHRMMGNLPPVEETMAMRVGNYMERFILDEYHRKTGREVMEYPETQVHPDEPRIICHCDGITVDRDRLIEIKNVGHRMSDAWKDGVPEYYWVQGCGQSMLTGIMKVDFAAYFGGNDLRIFEVEYTKEDHTALYDGLKDFLFYVDNDEEPPHEQADLPNLDKYCTPEPGVYKITDGDLEESCKRLAALKQTFKPDKETKDAMDRLEFEIKEYMAGAEALRDKKDNVLFTWKKGKDKEVVDWEAVARELSYMRDDDDVALNSLLKSKTTIKPGSRTFLCKIKE